MNNKQFILEVSNKGKEHLQRLQIINNELKILDELLIIPKSAKHHLTKMILSKANLVFTTLQNCPKLFKWVFFFFNNFFVKFNFVNLDQHKSLIWPLLMKQLNVMSHLV